MAQHDVSFTVPDRPVGNADIEFRVKRDGKAVGTLLVSKGSLVWLPKHARKGFKLGWLEFGQLIEKYGMNQKGITTPNIPTIELGEDGRIRKR